MPDGISGYRSEIRYLSICSLETTTTSFGCHRSLSCGRKIRMCSNALCLGDPWCSFWNCCRIEPPAKKARSASNEYHFSSPHSPSTMVKICEGYMPKNTTKSTGLTLRVFHARRKQHNEHTDDKCPEKSCSKNLKLNFLIFGCLVL